MGLFNRLLGSSKSDDLPSLPWEQKPSLYEYIKERVRPDAPGLGDDGNDLPDADRAFAGSQVRWVGGAMDGVGVFHMGTGSDQDQVETLVHLVLDYCKAPSVRNKLKVYENVQKVHTLSVIDPFVEKLREASGVDANRLYELAKSFAVEAVDREPVKLGIGILGLFGRPEDRDIFRTLGRHDEFTLFSVVAISHRNNAEQEIWELAKQVEGWGRIHAIERLASTENPEIKRWLLRRGYKNSIMYEYLAYTCATTGGLLTALQEDQIDDELLEAAGDLISALIAGGPAKGMDSYEEGAAAVEYYLGHLTARASKVAELLAVDQIQHFVSSLDRDWDALTSSGWTEERRRALSEQCSEIIQRPLWPQIVTDGLNSADEMTFFNANQAASLLKIDTWSYHWRRLQETPSDSGRWYHAMQSCGQLHVGDVVAFAEQTLPLSEIGSGPGDELGLGKGYEAHGSLGFVVQELNKFPGVGTRLIEVSLNSQVIPNRNTALRTLSIWGRAAWPDSIEPVLRDALTREPDDDVRKSIQKVLEGESLE